MATQNLDLQKLIKGNIQYFKQIFIDYLKENFKENDLKNYYYRNSKDDKTIYNELMKINFITIEANSDDEAKLLDFILEFLFNDSFDNYEDIIDDYREYETTLKNPITIEKILFLANLLDQYALKSFELYITETFIIDVTKEKDKNKRLEGYCKQLTAYQLWNLKDWLDGRLTDKDLDLYNVKFNIEDQEYEEEDILIDDFMSYIININNLLQYKFCKSKKVRQPPENDFDYFSTEYKINFKREYDIIFDKKTVINLLSMKLDDDISKRMIQICNINIPIIKQFEKIIKKFIRNDLTTRLYDQDKDAWINKFININKYKIQLVINELISNNITLNDDVREFCYEIFQELTI